MKITRKPPGAGTLRTWDELNRGDVFMDGSTLHIFTSEKTAVGLQTGIVWEATNSRKQSSLFRLVDAELLFDENSLP